MSSIGLIRPVCKTQVVEWTDVAFPLTLERLPVSKAFLTSSHDWRDSLRLRSNAVILHPVLELVNQVVSAVLCESSAIVDRLQEGFPRLNSIARRSAFTCALHSLSERDSVRARHDGVGLRWAGRLRVGFWEIYWDSMIQVLLSAGCLIVVQTWRWGGRAPSYRRARRGFWLSMRTPRLSLVQRLRQDIIGLRRALHATVHSTDPQRRWITTPSWRYLSGTGPIRPQMMAEDAAWSHPRIGSWRMWLKANYQVPRPDERCTF